MTITLELPHELELQLREEADQKGVSLKHHILQRLDETGAFVGNMPLTESELLQKINIGLPEEVWFEYHRLTALRKAALLTDVEHQRLIELVNIIEMAHAERMKHVVNLAQLRGTTLDQIMDDLGLKPVEDD